jgi:hypothetical protein
VTYRAVASRDQLLARSKSRQEIAINKWGNEVFWELVDMIECHCDAMGIDSTGKRIATFAVADHYLVVNRQIWPEEHLVSASMNRNEGHGIRMLPLRGCC